jgi:hypothetical protein
MIETNSFLVMFGVLVLTVALMHMVLLTRFVRAKTAEVPEEYFAQLSPGVSRERSTKIFISRYRAAHVGVAVAGTLLLAWFLDYMQRPDWDKRWVVFPVVGYFVLQWLPMAVAAVTGLKHLAIFKSFLAQAKRKAVLKRRGLFDFVSPATVVVSALVYLLFVAYTARTVDELAPRLVFIGTVSMNYVLTILGIRKMLYGKKSDPFETHAERLYMIGVRAKSSIHGATAVALFMGFTVAVMRSDFQRWMPFALAAFLTLMTFITFSVFTARPRHLRTDALDSNEVAS